MLSSPGQSRENCTERLAPVVLKFQAAQLLQIAVLREHNPHRVWESQPLSIALQATSSANRHTQRRIHSTYMGEQE